MNFPASVTNTQHDHPGQKVLEYLAQLQQHNALLKASLALSQKALARSQKALALSQKENTLQQELITRLQINASNHPSHLLKRAYLSRPVMFLRGLPGMAFHVQDLVIKPTSVEYLLDQWITPDGKTVTDRPPARLHGHHYGPTLQACILHQYFGGGAQQPDH